MSTDRKSDHYTSAQHYRDLDGNSKSFTFVDHDVKPSISVTSSSKEEVELLKKEVRNHTERVIEEILSFPAVNILKNSYGMYEEFVVRNIEKGVIEWNEEMVKNACRVNDILRYNMSMAIWKGSVKEQHWFDDMSHEDIIAGKWRELI